MAVPSSFRAKRGAQLKRYRRYRSSLLRSILRFPVQENLSEGSVLVTEFRYFTMGGSRHATTILAGRSGLHALRNPHSDNLCANRNNASGGDGQRNDGFPFAALRDMTPNLQRHV